MKRYENNSQAPYGMYLSTRPFDVRLVNGHSERLEGLEGASYRRLSMWLVVALGPILGGAFVLLFPLIVLASPVAALLHRSQSAVVEEHAYVARGGFQPAMSYFKGEQGADEQDPQVADLADEVQARVDDSADA